MDEVARGRRPYLASSSARMSRSSLVALLLESVEKGLSLSRPRLDLAPVRRRVAKEGHSHEHTVLRVSSKITGLPHSAAGEVRGRLNDLAVLDNL